MIFLSLGNIRFAAFSALRALARYAGCAKKNEAGSLCSSWRKGGKPDDRPETVFRKFCIEE
jgi:hypothetical protein